MESGKLAYYLDIIELVMLCAIAFLIPVYVWASPIIIAGLVVLFFVRPRNYVALKESIKSVGFWAMTFLFVLYLIGLIYSDDTNTAMKNTETAMSLIAFPLIATAFRQNKIEKKHKFVKTSLIAGALAIMAFCLIRAFINYAETHDSTIFFYTNLLSSPHHHSYHVLFSLIILTHSMINNYSQLSKLSFAIEIAISIMLIIFIVLLSSKITILILAVYALYLVARLVISKKIPKWITILIVILTISSLPALYSVPVVNARINNMISGIKNHVNGTDNDDMHIESTNIRFKCLSSVLDVISENWLIGTGQGDVYAEMQKQMRKRMGDDYEGTCSPHNQFLRTFASFGIIGIATLLLLFFTMLRKAIKLRNATMIWWCIITICFFCIEDMFCIINGIVFFCLFTGIMLLGKNNGQKG